MSTIVTILGTLLSNPDVLIVAAAAFSGAIGWYAKVRHNGGSLPAGVADLVKQLAEKQALAAAHGSLTDLLNHAPAVVPGVAQPAAPPAPTQPDLVALLAQLAAQLAQAQTTHPAPQPGRPTVQTPAVVGAAP